MKRDRRATKFWMARVVVAFLAASAGVPQTLAQAGALPSSGKVVSVFDGDTVQLESGIKIRYLAIDAPEVAHEEPADCFADEAKKVNADWVLNRRITLKYDSAAVDAYGRLLAYVFLPDGRCVNREMLRGGYAFVYRTSEPLSRLDELLAIQRDAIRSKRGMWGRCSVKKSASYIGNRRSFVFHRPECPFAKKMSQRNRVQLPERLAGFEEGYHPCRTCKP